MPNLLVVISKPLNPRALAIHTHTCTINEHHLVIQAMLLFCRLLQQPLPAAICTLLDNKLPALDVSPGSQCTTGGLWPISNNVRCNRPAFNKTRIRIWQLDDMKANLAIVLCNVPGGIVVIPRVHVYGLLVILTGDDQNPNTTNGLMPKALVHSLHSSDEIQRKHLGHFTTFIGRIVQ